MLKTDPARSEVGTAPDDTSRWYEIRRFMMEERRLRDKRPGEHVQLAHCALDFFTLIIYRYEIVVDE